MSDREQLSNEGLRSGESGSQAPGSLEAGSREQGAREAGGDAAAALKAGDAAAAEQPKAGPAIFGLQAEERARFPVAAWIVAALIVAVVVGVLGLAGRRKPAAAPDTLQPADAYAANLPLTEFTMSEAENLSGGKLTYLDGHIDNTGGRTVTGVTVQVVFGNDVGLPPEIYTVPLTLIRTRQPYIDTEPVSADPLKPGDDREFRLTFETVPENWNTVMPQVRIIEVDSR